MASSLCSSAAYPALLPPCYDNAAMSCPASPPPIFPAHRLLAPGGPIVLHLTNTCHPLSLHVSMSLTPLELHFHSVTSMVHGHNLALAHTLGSLHGSRLALAPAGCKPRTSPRQPQGAWRCPVMPPTSLNASHSPRRLVHSLTLPHLPSSSVSSTLLSRQTSSLLVASFHGFPHLPLLPPYTETVHAPVKARPITLGTIPAPTTYSRTDTALSQRPQPLWYQGPALL